MKYLSLLRMAETTRDLRPPAPFAEAMGRLIEKNRRSGVLLDTAGLTPSRDGFRMRVAGGRLTTVDGPFAEGEGIVGGWAIMNADSREEMLRQTAEFLELYRTHWPELEVECEVRPIDFLLSDADDTT